MLLYINKGSQLREVERAILPYTLHAATKGDLVYYRHPNWNLLGKRYASAHSLVVSSSIRSNCIMQERTAIPGHGETSRPKRPGPSLNGGSKNLHNLQFLQWQKVHFYFLTGITLVRHRHPRQRNGNESTP